jgi:Fe-Mn family superoxide dismutase
MEHQLPACPSPNALAPHMSAETFDYHYSKHHQAYVTNLNNLIKGTEYETLDLEAIVKKAPAGGVYNNAAQVWNHTFFWNCLTPNGGGAPKVHWLTPSTPSGVPGCLQDRFPDLRCRQLRLRLDLARQKGRWLRRHREHGRCRHPLTTGDKALLCVDVWEHAYYIDYRNMRPKFVETYLNNLVNWSFAEANFAA